MAHSLLCLKKEEKSNVAHLEIGASLYLSVFECNKRSAERRQALREQKYFLEKIIQQMPLEASIQYGLYEFTSTAKNRFHISNGNK